MVSTTAGHSALLTAGQRVCQWVAWTVFSKVVHWDWMTVDYSVDEMDANWVGQSAHQWAGLTVDKLAATMVGLWA